jgi:hypothetical protein
MTTVANLIKTRAGDIVVGRDTGWDVEIVLRPNDDVAFKVVLTEEEARLLKTALERLTDG